VCVLLWMVCYRPKTRKTEGEKTSVDHGYLLVYRSLVRKTELKVTRRRSLLITTHLQRLNWRIVNGQCEILFGPIHIQVFNDGRWLKLYRPIIVVDRIVKGRING